MSTKMTAQEIAAKQISRAKAAIGDYKKGIQAVTESPTAIAARNVDKWFSGLQKAKDEGTYVDGCNAVSLQSWQDSALTKGAANMAGGLDKSIDKVIDFQEQRAAFQQRIDSQLASTPRGDLSTNLQRAMTQMQEMAKFRFKRKRR